MTESLEQQLDNVVKDAEQWPEWKQREANVETPNMTDFDIAIQRMTAWIRDYADKKSPAFIGDLCMLLLTAKENTALHQKIKQLREELENAQLWIKDATKLYDGRGRQIEELRKAVSFRDNEVMQLQERVDELRGQLSLAQWSEETVRVRDSEITQLRSAIRDAGFEVCQTSGAWTLHDVSEYGKAEEEKSFAVATRNVDLEIEIKRLQEELAPLIKLQSALVDVVMAGCARPPRAAQTPARAATQEEQCRD